MKRNAAAAELSSFLDRISGRLVDFVLVLSFVLEF